ncbi:dol-P-Man:Man(7)GlcNAc(2)-PP-Dol alpha-1,6-mannosyltransferase isoform X3 [Lathyrus oleraceus]|uniref:dol-P-Man:Man(7)GlcNAc(2)-PP-Dol alpha-1,6-mannosyltransferase isoform X3 n=1 Tax=Pisum sativum TaxID=3888 RepID=UPI0021CFE038|nr:dol-P-Man:Man(7)GlcNAc(2)-PP-Dol alpha-1,6-mannosyltransferase-like isoform X3 [Pisum sativum]
MTNQRRFRRITVTIWFWDESLLSTYSWYLTLRSKKVSNVQAMHDILYHRFHIDNFDYLEFPGVVPRTFIGALLVSLVASPIVLIASLLHLPKFYALLIVRMVIGCIILYTLRFFRQQIRNKFGRQVETFFVILTSIQFHFLFYCSRPLPNILALGIVNLAFGYWFQGRFLCCSKLFVNYFNGLNEECDVFLQITMTR